MKKAVIITGLAVMLFSGGYIGAQDDEGQHKEHSDAGQKTVKKAQTACPVMGGKIDKKVYTDYNDKRVYFCCAGCIPQFKKDPGTYLKKLEAEGVVPEPVPAAADAEKKEAPKDTGAQAAPKAEHKHGGGGGCH